MWTPCDNKDENGQHKCPYADTYTGYADEMCRVCCGLGVDEDCGQDDYYDDWENEWEEVE